MNIMSSCVLRPHRPPNFRLVRIPTEGEGIAILIILPLFIKEAYIPDFFFSISL